MHLRTLQGVLAKAPHRDALLEFLQPIYAREELHRLTDFNTALVRGVVERLGITTQLVMASELSCQGSSSRLMLNLTKAVGGDTYLSGPSGRNYLDPEMFPAEGVTLRYHRFDRSSTRSRSRRSSQGSVASTTSRTSGSVPGDVHGVRRVRPMRRPRLGREPIQALSRNPV